MVFSMIYEENQAKVNQIKWSFNTKNFYPCKNILDQFNTCTKFIRTIPHNQGWDSGLSFRPGLLGKRPGPARGGAGPENLGPARAGPAGPESENFLKKFWKICSFCTKIFQLLLQKCQRFKISFSMIKLFFEFWSRWLRVRVRHV